MDDPCILWFRRAESAFNLGKAPKSEKIYYEDLCFQLQQAAEKALKACLIYYKEIPTKTHSFRRIFIELETHTDIPSEVARAIEMEDYSVQTRYPGDYEPVTEEEYNTALKITENVINWAKRIIE